MIDIRVSHGMVLGDNNEKMSKSKGNVINPDDIVKEYGADVLRVYEMFMGDYEMDAPWSTSSLRGCKRFIDRIIRLKNKVVDGNNYTESLSVIINKTIKKVTDDILNMGYNTAVAALMILLNTYEDQSTITKEDYHLILTLLNPFAPHITEELNEELGYKPICETAWPVYDASKIEEQEKEIGVQVNGKLRASIKVNVNDDEEELKNKALKEDNVKKYVEGKEIVKVIAIKGRIVNIVVK